MIHTEFFYKKARLPRGKSSQLYNKILVTNYPIFFFSEWNFTWRVRVEQNWLISLPPHLYYRDMIKVNEPIQEAHWNSQMENIYQVESTASASPYMNGLGWVKYCRRLLLVISIFWVFAYALPKQALIFQVSGYTFSSF